MSTSAKAVALAHELADRLKVLMAPADLEVVESFDDDQNPLISVGDLSTPGTDAALIKVMPQEWDLAQDILGNSAIQYTPHVMKISVEANPTGGSGADAVTAGFILKLLAQSSAFGTRVELYNSNNGTSPAVADFDGTAVGTYDADLYHALISQQ